MCLRRQTASLKLRAAAFWDGVESAVVYSNVVARRPCGRGLVLRTLDRYIFREVAATWLAVSGVLLVILVSNQLARVLTQAAANDFPRGVVLALIGLTSAGYLSVVVPIGFFLAILLALGRLYHESEMAAIQSCGVGPAGLYRPIALLGAAIFGLLVWLSFWAIPGATARAKELRAEALRDAQFGSLEPGRFRTFAGGRVVFYAERVDDNKILHNVHVFVERPAEKAQGKSGDAVASSRSDDADKLEIWVATARGAARRRTGRTDVRALRRRALRRRLREAASFASSNLPRAASRFDSARSPGVPPTPR